MGEPEEVSSDQGRIHGGCSWEEDISELLREKRGLLGREPHLAKSETEVQAKCLRPWGSSGARSHRTEEWELDFVGNGSHRRLVSESVPDTLCFRQASPVAM